MLLTEDLQQAVTDERSKERGSSGGEDLDFWGVNERASHAAPSQP